MCPARRVPIGQPSGPSARRHTHRTESMQQGDSGRSASRLRTASGESRSSPSRRVHGGNFRQRPGSDPLRVDSPLMSINRDRANRRGQSQNPLPEFPLDPERCCSQDSQRAVLIGEQLVPSLAGHFSTFMRGEISLKRNASIAAASTARSNARERDGHACFPLLAMARRV